MELSRRAVAQAAIEVSVTGIDPHLDCHCPSAAAFWRFLSNVSRMTSAVHTKLTLVTRAATLITFKETQSNLRKVSIECIDKVIQNALIFYDADCYSIKTR